MSILERKIFAHSEHHVVGSVVLMLVNNPVIKIFRALRGIVSVKLLVSNEGLVIRPGVEVEAWRWAVMVEQRVSEDLGTLAESIPHWSLNPFHGLCL